MNWILKNNLFKYKWLLEELVIRDLKIKYRRSVLGYLWSVLNPLLMMLVLTVVFSTVFRFDIPNYPVYLLTGQLLFNFYSESTTMAMDSILSGAALIKKVYLPKYIFPLSRVLSTFTTLLFSLLALFIVMIVTSTSFHITLILLPVVFLYMLIFSLGVSLILAVSVVYFRDIKHLYGVFLSALNFLTPIFYPTSILPEWLKSWMIFNPLYDYIEFLRDILLYGRWPTWEENLLCIACSIGFLAVGMWVLKSTKRILYFIFDLSEDNHGKCSRNKRYIYAL